jgi:SpoIID/LytB domain protein
LGGGSEEQVKRRLEASCPPVLRIGVVRNERRIEMHSAGRISLRYGGLLVPTPQTGGLVFEVGDSVPAKPLYRVCVASYRGSERRKAWRALSSWRGQGYGAVLVRRGRKLTIGDHLVDNRALILSVSAHTDRDDAVRVREHLSAADVPAWIEEEAVAPAAGTIVVRDVNNATALEITAPVSLTSNSPITIANVNFGFWNERREDRSYEGTLEIGLGKGGALQVVEYVDLESYILGVVPAEMPSSWPEAALQAQSVAARTETAAKIGTRHLADGYDLCATEHCQAYGGLNRRAPPTTAAATVTRGIILMEGVRPVDTVYSLNCGGHTENVENVWWLNAAPALRGRLDVFGSPGSLPSPIGESEIAGWVTTRPEVMCAESYRAENFRWKKAHTADEIDNFVSAKLGNIGPVTDIVPLERGVSGRLKSLKVVGARGEKIVRKELPIRSLFGGLYSAALVVDVERDDSGKLVSVTFAGAGRGHGVGMCQDGARGRALRGATYRQILEHYYAAASIVKLYGTRF